MASLHKDPVNYEELMTSIKKKVWKIAIREELESMNANQMWTLISRPKDVRTNIIDSKWVFKRKLDIDGSKTQGKASNKRF